MKLYTVLLLYIVLAIAGPSAAVVHGIQSLSVGGRFESSNDNRNGYRYNGPAHKYLPAASEPATDALTTTGHWLPNPQPQSYPYPHSTSMQQLPYEFSYSSSTPTTTPGRPFQQQEKESQYNGPYNTQYYDQEHQLTSSLSSLSSRQQNYNNNMNTFQFATNHRDTGASPTGAEFGQTFGLSAGTQHDRYMEPSQRAPPLIGQALPERYQRQPFLNEQQLGGSTGNFVQMQSHSYELPPTYNMQQGEWLQHLSSAPVQHQEHREQAFEYPAQYPAQGQAYEQYSPPAPSSFQSFPASHAHLASPASPSTSYLPPPSREFLAPYY